MNLFLDSSALVKLYYEELNSQELMEAIQREGIQSFLLSSLTKVEFASAIYKKVRQGDITEKFATQVIEIFTNDYNKFQWIDGESSTIWDLSNRMIRKYGMRGLRTLDSLQLVSAIESKKIENTLYITFDSLLREIFLEEQLPLLNGNFI